MTKKRVSGHVISLPSGLESKHPKRPRGGCGKLVLLPVLVTTWMGTLPHLDNDRRRGTWRIKSTRSDAGRLGNAHRGVFQP